MIFDFYEIQFCYFTAPDEHFDNAWLFSDARSQNDIKFKKSEAKHEQV